MIETFTIVEPGPARLINGVHQVFGRTFVALALPHKPGDVIAGVGEGSVAMRVLRESSHAEVAAQLAGTGKEGRLISGRRWYEVLAD